MKWTRNDWLVFFGVLGYALFPIDILPDIFGPICWLDDAAVIGWGVKYFADKKKKATPPVQTITVKRKASPDDEPIDVEFENV